MMSPNNRKNCEKCNSFCNINRRLNIKCRTCSNIFHKTCIKNDNFNSYKDNLAFVCGKCLIYQLPFWILETYEIVDMSYSGKSENCFSNLNPDFLNEIFDDHSSQNEEENEFIESYGCDRYFVSSELDSIDLSQNENLFKSFCLNIRSLQNPSHFSQLQMLLNEMPIKPTVVAINETFLKSNLRGPHCNLEGYTFAPNCRNNNKGGGVGIYVKKTY